MFSYFKDLFYIDQISILMLGLLAFVGTCIGAFAHRYMKGDSRYLSFFSYLVLLLLSIGVMVSADHMMLLFCSWCISNFILAKLMVHKASWRAAKNSGMLALKNFLLGAVCVGSGLFFLYTGTGEVSIKAAIHTNLKNNFTDFALFFLLLGAMAQSAIWPFHRWLISSLNSPTPVSAIMHAGLINGGGFLLARFAPLYLQTPNMLTLIFVIGMATALIGTLWKLMQHDVKRMLACSTMGQMGFMLAQCGLGLFPAAIAHLLTHGLFKAFLFLGSDGAVFEKRQDLSCSRKGSVFICALFCGLVGSCCFAFTSGKSWFAGDTTLVLMVIALLTTSQAALTILAMKIRHRISVALSVSSIMGLIYGLSVYSLSKILEPAGLMQPMPINYFHIGGITLLVASWLSIVFLNKKRVPKFLEVWTQRGYVAALNASQPHPSTITTHRNQYKYL
ncbi:MAG: proton-conducting transporter membrane subunit [Candidatus Algichlamydia australiensis]|nr:proton-conducting transporter membrane subunit [Chlamydiales bacterium]